MLALCQGQPYAKGDQDRASHGLQPTLYGWSRDEFAQFAQEDTDAGEPDDAEESVNCRQKE